MVKQASAQGLKWFQDQRFGMFIHWGLYSILGKQEWIMHVEQIPVPDYEKLAQQFNPTKFNAEEWVSVAADAGQKYMVITSRHHDGFSMYDTSLSDYKVTNTPFRRDPIQELANVCARRGDVKLGDKLVVDGYLAKDGSHLIDARRVTLPDGRRVDGGSEGDGAPQR